MVFTCITSDFFIEDADPWRGEIWKMMKERSDLTFFIITKRITRFYSCIPEDWNDGYKNVNICCTVENQKQCDIRLPFFNSIPVCGKYIACEPLLENINLKKYLNESMRQVLAGGESGPGARVCEFDWILDIRIQCIEMGVPFYFKQTGARFKKDGRIYNIPRKYQHSQARKANLNTTPL